MGHQQTRNARFVFCIQGRRACIQGAASRPGMGVNIAERFVFFGQMLQRQQQAQVLQNIGVVSSRLSHMSRQASPTTAGSGGRIV